MACAHEVKQLPFADFTSTLDLVNALLASARALATPVWGGGAGSSEARASFRYRRGETRVGEDEELSSGAGGIWGGGGPGACSREEARKSVQG